jgi:hypothetical protein
MISAKIFFSLILLTIILWLLSIIYTPIIDEVLPADPLFFAKNLSVFYWLSLAMLLVLLLLRVAIPTKKRIYRLLDIFLICCLVLIIYGTPCLVYNLPVYVDTYIHTSTSLKILLRGHIPPPLSMMGASNNPGAYFFFSIFMLTTNLDSLIFMRYYPILRSSVMLLSLYVVSLKFASSKFAVLAPFVYTAFNYFRFHVYPGGLSHFFYLLFILFFLFLVERNKKEFKLLTLIIVSTATITYILAPPLLLLSSLLPFIPLLWKMKAQRNFIVPIIIFVVWASWLIYVSQGSFTYITSWLRKALTESIAVSLPTQVVSLPSVRIISLLMKQAITVFAISAGILTTLLCLINIKENLERQKALIIGGNFIVCCLALFASLAFVPEASTRFYSFLLIPYSLLIPVYISAKQDSDGSNLRKLKRIVTCALLVSTIVFLSITPIVRNDNDPGFYYPSSSLKGAEFAVDYLMGNIMWVRNHVHLIEYAASKKGILLEGYMGLQQNDNVSFISISRYIGLPPELGLFHPVEGTFLSYFSKEAVRHCDAMIFNSYEDAMMIMAGEERYSKMRVLYEMYVSEVMNKVYSSGSIRIYYRV